MLHMFWNFYVVLHAEITAEKYYSFIVILVQYCSVEDTWCVCVLCLQSSSVFLLPVQDLWRHVFVAAFLHFSLNYTHLNFVSELSQLLLLVMHICFHLQTHSTNITVWYPVQLFDICCSLRQDQFFDYMIQQAIKLDQKVLLDNRSKFVLVHASSGFKHSLRGIVKNSDIICVLLF